MKTDSVTPGFEMGRDLPGLGHCWCWPCPTQITFPSVTEIISDAVWCGHKTNLTGSIWISSLWYFLQVPRGHVCSPELNVKAFEACRNPSVDFTHFGTWLLKLWVWKCASSLWSSVISFPCLLRASSVFRETLWDMRARNKTNFLPHYYNKTHKPVDLEQ